LHVDFNFSLRRSVHFYPCFFFEQSDHGICINEYLIVTLDMMIYPSLDTTIYCLVDQHQTKQIDSQKSKYQSIKKLCLLKEAIQFWFFFHPYAHWFFIKCSFFELLYSIYSNEHCSNSFNNNIYFILLIFNFVTLAFNLPYTII
jgi:hypothetical protein